MNDLPPPPKAEVHIVSDISQTNLQMNPLCGCHGLPQFDKIQTEHIVPAITAALEEAERELAALENIENPTWDNLMYPLEMIQEDLHDVIGPVVHLTTVKDSKALREAWDEMLPKTISFQLKLRQNSKICHEVKKLKETGGPFSTPQERVIDKYLLAAKLTGLELEGKEKEQFNKLQLEQAQLQTQFRNNLLDEIKHYSLIIENKEEIEGLPQSYRALASQAYNQNNEGAQSTPENGPWKLSLEPTIFLGAMKTIDSPKVRETLYRAHITKASNGIHDNSKIIPRILQIRQESAHLLGFNTYAEVSLATKMAKDVESVDELLETLRLASWEPAKKEFDELNQFAASKGYATPLKQWDTAYWSEKLREERFNFTEEELRPYFQLPNVLDGLFSLSNKLFGITVKQDATAPIWNPDVRYFIVEDQNGKQIASFYLDPYSRPENKRGGAWMENCLNRRVVDSQMQLPVTYLCCNMPPPTAGHPALLTFREVETLFHEFGHGLQHMLTSVDYPSAGIDGVEWDAVELASQFMENWCRHKETLRGMTSHFETGEPIPDALYEKLIAAHTFMAGSAMLRQLNLGICDMELHHRYDPYGDRSVFDVMKQISQKTSHLPYFEGERFFCSFSHIFLNEGYAAGYYSYKWAEVLSSDAFSAFEEVGLNNPEEVAKVGMRYRDTILSEGGGRDPMDVFVSFRGREPTTDALLRHSGLK